MSKIAAFTFARMNPPTLGHELLISGIVSEALEKRGDAFLFLSHTQDSIKNPLSYDQKVHFAKELFQEKYPELHIYDGEGCRNAREVPSYLHSLGYTEIVGIFGSDRVDEMYTLLQKGNGKEGLASGFYEFDNISVTSAGERDPEADDVEGISATKLREYAAEDNFEKFKAGVPTDNEELARDIFRATRQGLGMPNKPLNESGGAVTSDRIPLKNVNPTIEVFVDKVLNFIPHQKYAIIGSTGKKPDNGDLDLGVETPLSLEDISQALRGLDVEHMVMKGLNEISCRFPQYEAGAHKTDLWAQVDLMIGNLDWLEFVFYVDRNTKYKPMARTGLLFGLLKVAAIPVQGENTPAGPSETQWSFAPTRGMFLKQGTKRTNRKGEEVIDWKNVSAYTPDPNKFCEVAFAQGRHAVTPAQLQTSFEKCWDLVADVFSANPVMLGNLAQYVMDFCRDKDISPVPDLNKWADARKLALGETAWKLNEYVQYIAGHKDSKGGEAPWVVKSHETGKILSSHTSQTKARQHLAQMEMHKHMAEKYEHRDDGSDLTRYLLDPQVIQGLRSSPEPLRTLVVDGLKQFGISVKDSAASEDTAFIYPEVGIEGGVMFANGKLQIIIDVDQVEEILEGLRFGALDDYKKFVKYLTAVYAHEKIHDAQLKASGQEHAIRRKDIMSLAGDDYGYLSNEREIHAQASSAVDEWLALGYAPEQIRKWLSNTTELAQHATEAPAVWDYWKGFGKYTDDESVKVWRQFLKQVYDFTRQKMIQESTDSDKIAMFINRPSEAIKEGKFYWQDPTNDEIHGGKIVSVDAPDFIVEVECELCGKNCYTDNFRDSQDKEWWNKAQKLLEGASQSAIQAYQRQQQHPETHQVNIVSTEMAHLKTVSIS